MKRFSTTQYNGMKLLTVVEDETGEVKIVNESIDIGDAFNSTFLSEDRFNATILAYNTINASLFLFGVSDFGFPILAKGEEYKEIYENTANYYGVVKAREVDGNPVLKLRPTNGKPNGKPLKVLVNKPKYFNRVDIPAMIEPVAELRKIAIEEIGKYDEGFEFTDLEPHLFIDAIQRHLNKIYSAQDTWALDEETGLPHFYALGFNYMALSMIYRGEGNGDNV